MHSNFLRVASIFFLSSSADAFTFVGPNLGVSFLVVLRLDGRNIYIRVRYAELMTRL